MTRDQKICRLAYWIASVIVAGILLLGYRKILYPAEFAKAVHAFHLLPGRFSYLVNPVALYLPWLELVCGICLLFVPRLRIGALWITLVLLLAFTAAIGINLWRGAEIGCGCFGFGPDERPISWIHIARNSGLILLVMLALISKRRI